MYRVKKITVPSKLKWDYDLTPHRVKRGAELDKDAAWPQIIFFCRGDGAKLVYV